MGPTGKNVVSFMGGIGPWVYMHHETKSSSYSYMSQIKGTYLPNIITTILQ